MKDCIDSALCGCGFVLMSSDNHNGDKKRKIIKNDKRCRDGMTKNNTNKGGYKSEGKYTKPYLPLHLFTLKLHFNVRKMQGCIFTFTFIASLVCVIFCHAIPISLFIFNDFIFLFLFAYFFGDVF